MQIHTTRDLGAVVREARQANHLSQAELASRAGVSRDSVLRLEQGHPRLETQLVLDVLTAAGVVLTADSSARTASDETSAHWDEVFADLSVAPASTSPTDTEQKHA